jgi:hypothetical protein
MNWQKKGHKRTYDEQKQTSKALTYFTEHFMGVFKKPPQEHNGNKKNSSLFYGDSRAIPAGRHSPAADGKHQHLTRRSAPHWRAPGEHKLTAKTKPLSGKEPCGTGLMNGKCKARPAGDRTTRNLDAENKDLGAQLKLVAVNCSYSR